MTVCHLLDELLEERRGKTGIAGLEENRYWLFIAMDERPDAQAYLGRVLEQFWQFTEEHAEFHCALYPGNGSVAFAENHRQLTQRLHANREKKKGIFTDATDGQEEDEAKGAVEQAIAYIRKNLRRGVSRTEVADHVHLNEEYFSRLFKKETGVGFKEFEQAERTEEAKKYLSQSVLSVEVIASKLGYKSLSQFSAAFKKMTDLSPQEYRRQTRGEA